MATMRTCPFTLGLLGVTDLGPSCCALNATAAFAWKPCWTGSSQPWLPTTGTLRASPFRGDTGLWCTCGSRTPQCLYCTFLREVQQSQSVTQLSFLPFLSESGLHCGLKALAASPWLLLHFLSQAFPLINFLHIYSLLVVSFSEVPDSAHQVQMFIDINLVYTYLNTLNCLISKYKEYF